MDEKKRTELRDLALRRFRNVTVALGLIFVAAMVFGILQARIARNASRATLARESAALTREFMRFEFDRGRELIPFPPPRDPAIRTAWAEGIEEELGQPAAIGVVIASRVTWVTKPPAFVTAADSVELMMVTPSLLRRRAQITPFGVMDVMHAAFQPEGDDTQTLWLLGIPGDSLEWAVLVSANDTWAAFFKRLKDASANRPDIGTPAWALQDVFGLPGSSTQRWNMGVQAFLHDSLIYSSPGVDTTRLSYTYDFNGRKAVCYLSRWQQMQQRWMSMRWFFWPMLAFPLLLMVPLYRFYLLVKSLTESESS